MNGSCAASEAARAPQRVVGLVDGDLFVAHELLRRFVQDLPAAWRAIEDAMASGTPTRVAQAVHYLRGSVALVGADSLTRRLDRWERDAGRGCVAVSIADLLAARGALDVLLDAMRDFLGPPVAGQVAAGGGA